MIRRSIWTHTLSASLLWCATATAAAGEAPGDERPKFRDAVTTPGGDVIVLSPEAKALSLQAMRLIESGDAHREAGDDEAARADYAEALRLSVGILEAEPMKVTHQQNVAGALLRLSVVSEPDDAVAHARLAVKIRGSIAERHPDDRDIRHELATAQFRLGNALDRASESGDTRYERATAAFATCVDIFERLIMAAGDDDFARELRRELSAIYTHIATVDQRHRRSDRATGWLMKAAKLNRDAYNRDSTDTDSAMGLVIALVRLGDIDARQRLFGKALNRYEEAMRVIEPLVLKGRVPTQHRNIPSFLDKRIALCKGRLPKPTPAAPTTPRSDSKLTTDRPTTIDAVDVGAGESVGAD